MADDRRMNPETEKKEVCDICYEVTGCNRMVPVCHSMHRYCIPCVEKHLDWCYYTGKSAKCPHGGCNLLVNIDSCSSFLSQRMKEAMIPADSRFYCPHPRCSFLMSKLDLISKNVSTITDSEVRRCFKCKELFCLKCKVPWHHNQTCDDYQQSSTPDTIGEKELMNLAKDKGWRQCRRCNNMIELDTGCNHMVCRCGYQFCYGCGDQWGPEGQTCKCEAWNGQYNIV